MSTFSFIFSPKKLNKIFLLFLLPLEVLSQNTIGLPEVSNYNKVSYVAGLQNWDIKQDKNGILYFANNEGLLSFNGKYWKLFPLPNKTIARSIEIGFDNNIYVGGQDEIGYFQPNKNGILTYTSLCNKIDGKLRNFGDVWDILTIGKDIFFRSTKHIFKLSGQNITSYKAPSEWSFLGASGGKVYAHDYENGLMLYKNEVWTPFEQINSLAKNDPVTGIISINNYQSYLITLKNGLFKLNNGLITPFSNTTLLSIATQRIYAASKINDNQIALATNNNGLYIIDFNGNLIQKFSKKEGIQNNNILAVFPDKMGNIWLGLDNGIDCIAYSSAIKQILPKEVDASGYAIIIHNNELYLGTSSGLFYTRLKNQNDLSFSTGDFTEVANSSGQVWGLSEINNQLLLGHHEGAFIINNHIAQPLLNTEGHWNFSPTDFVFPSPFIVSGNYKGLRFFQYNNNSFIPAQTVPKFEESSRYLAIDNNNNIWVSHPYHGVYRITRESNDYRIHLYTNKKGLPKLLNNQIFKIKNQIVAATENGIFYYNQLKDRFEPDAFYQKLLGNQSIRYLKEDTEGNIWFIHEKSLGVIDLNGKLPKVVYVPELNNKMLSGFECIYPVNASNIFLGGEKGVYHINYEKYRNQNNEFKVRLSNVKINNQKDSILFGGYHAAINEDQLQTENSIPSIDYDWKNLHFEYAATIYGNENKLEFSYWLKGFDNNWSAWSIKSEKDYTNLPPGGYSFLIRCKNSRGEITESAPYFFKILPPWYRTNWAFTFYFLLMVSLLYYLYAKQRKKFHIQQTKFEHEQKKTNYLHQLEIDKAESALITLRNEKLQTEIDFKNSELATNAMHLVQKSELMNKIKSELNQIMKGIENEKTVNELKKMIKVLSEDEKMDKDWEHFAQHFDKVHSDFVIVVKKVHPSITANELKLATYLRMNLSTKEIAQLMNISVRGVEISRYRLRKKLGLATEVSLFDYLMSLSQHKAD